MHRDLERLGNGHRLTRSNAAHQPHGQGREEIGVPTHRGHARANAGEQEVHAAGRAEHTNGDEDGDEEEDEEDIDLRKSLERRNERLKTAKLLEEEEEDQEKELKTYAVKKFLDGYDDRDMVYDSL